MNPAIVHKMSSTAGIRAHSASNCGSFTDTVMLALPIDWIHMSTLHASVALLPEYRLIYA